ncbi:MAG: GntR family transcriptional regulator [Lentisphaerae bacterium]|nr:GntR family transcriptional regulator [Lentisphaerota bacterium]MCP4101549.1 GntR family transcriptional regulator [Lentisphaerota bacterium]
MKSTRSDLAYNTLLEQIVSGELSPGDRLPEVSIAKKMGISPTPVRECFRRLAAEGLVEFVPNAGCRVRKMSRKEVIELYQLREALESFCASCASMMMNRLDLDYLDECYVQMRDAVSKDNKPGTREMCPENRLAYMKADASFHARIVASSDNVSIIKVMRKCHILNHVMGLRSRMFIKSQVKKSLLQHRKIIKAIASGTNEAAAKEMREHLRYSCETSLINMKHQKPSEKVQSLSIELHKYIRSVEGEVCGL